MDDQTDRCACGKPCAGSCCVLGHISACTPIYGLANLARWPLYGGAPHLVWILNLVGWLIVFVSGAAWRMSKDTARV